MTVRDLPLPAPRTPGVPAGAGAPRPARPAPPEPVRLRPPTRAEMVAVGLRVLAHLGRGCATVALMTGAPVDIRLVSAPPGTRPARR